MTDPELTVNPSDEFELSVRQLFELLGTEQDNAPLRYYKVTWDEALPTKIDDVTTMTATPTGACRDQRWGQFYSAQLNITETSTNSGTTQRLIWCYTGPRQTRTPIEPDVVALAQDYSYEELTPATIVRTLSDRANSVDDYLSLVRTMQEYGALPVPSLVAGINKEIFRFVNHSPGVAVGPARNAFDQDKMFELINALPAFGAEAPRVAQGYLVSQLLRALSQRTKKTPASNVIADSAAATLETAIYRGIIPDEPRLMDRIFASRHLYAYPFATELLHDRLRVLPSPTTSRYVFGVKRTAFSIDYITAILEARDKELESHTKSLTKDSYLRGHEEGTPDHLYDILNGFLKLMEVPRIATGPHASEQVTGLTGVAPAFAHLLSALAVSRAQGSEAQVAFDKLCVEIVDVTLAPIIRRRVGKLAISADEANE